MAAGSTIGRWYDAYARSVYDFALRTCGDAELAWDVTQEAFLRALESGADRGEIRSPRGWLQRTAYRLIVDAWRRRGRLVPLDAARSVDGGGPLPEDVAVRREEAERLERALRSLPPRYRAVLLMRERDGLSYAEIAEITGMSLEAVRSSLYRARLALRARLAERGASPAAEGGGERG